jgi:hypothetical protein
MNFGSQEGFVGSVFFSHAQEHFHHQLKNENQKAKSARSESKKKRPFLGNLGIGAFSFNVRYDSKD